MAIASELSKERDQLFSDLFNNKIPQRVPVSMRLTYEFAAQYVGYNLFEAQWNTDKYEEIADIVCQDFPNDTLPVSTLRFPSLYTQLKANNWRMSSSGFLQHPEVEGLKKEEYDYFIASPFDCIVEKVLPRLYENLDTDDPNQKAFALAKAFKTHSDEFGVMGTAKNRLIEKYGYSNCNLAAGSCEAPLDYVADQLRGFKNILTDIRRLPDKVEAACEAITPYMIKMGKFKAPNPLGATFIPLHMAPYMRPKDFDRFYWPTFKRTVVGLKEMGQPSFIFCEQDWMRYLDYLYELPENTIMLFEYGDPKKAKEMLGDKHIISGFYPLTLFKTGTEEQCIDKAKELLDILAQGGKYIFNTDKSPVTLDSVNPDNVKAVLKYVSENANY